MTDAMFYGLWNPLLSYAVRRGIDRDTAKDLVIDAILKVIDQFDAGRGELLHFAYRVLGNAIRNHFRDRNRFDTLPHELADDGPTPHESAVMEEDARRAAMLLGALKGDLGAAEIEFLGILQEQMETDGKLNISVAARAIGIEPLKGHDLLRKVQRKLAKAEPRDMREEQLLMLEYMPVAYEKSSAAAMEPADETALYADLVMQTSDIAVFMRIATYVKNIRS